MARKRQAVVVIHGIGEQRPMATLRGFVRSLLLDFEVINEKVLFYNKPDQLSQSFELRTLCVYPTKGRARTDFFEYYWANNMRGTKLGHVFSWMTRLLVRKPNSVPPRVRWLYFLFWALTITMIVLLATGYVNPSLITDFKKYSIPGIAFYFLVAITNLFLTRYLGDAARYTDASPENIGERQTIRANGINLLKAIHDSKKYDRIIIIGHSLGTMIGYDIIKNLWAQYNDQFKPVTDIKQPKLDEMEGSYALASPPGSFKNFDLNQFQKAQSNLLQEEMLLGSPWKITDFITLGSPLAYSSILMADDRNDLIERQMERELPCCPPVAEKNGTLSYEVERKSGEIDCSKKVLHYGAPFACTRWHNAFYKNDFVGGPLKTVFGQGVEDKQLQMPGVLGMIPFLSHTHYWADPGKSIDRELPTLEWLRQIIIPDYARKEKKTDDIKNLPTP
jgi:hypothetical protein